jgi:hypothetical protein
VSQNLKAATQRELEARGMRLDSTAPQLLINFNATLSEQMRVSPGPTVGVGVGRGYYGYRYGMYGAWPMYTDMSTVTQYTEGTLNIDVVDAARRQLVWEGVVTKSVTQQDKDDMKAAIDVAVAAAFAKYRSRPGCGKGCRPAPPLRRVTQERRDDEGPASGLALIGPWRRDRRLGCRRIDDLAS